ncbi:extracellular calcium-sensing receptor-like [Nematolebias whitei]|uniref:extracellular calcium-sensing receptor-like n=1 Tax=Nematolebias whitei TaxID=451745 RepID=UPI001896DDA7|nr:extracellular calcium-sensing receptor-like [Nematolebias whitei]
MSEDGDFVIGGAFSIHHKLYTVIYNYTTKPESPRCTGSFNSRVLRFFRAMIFAIEEINNSTELLPGIKLGYEIHDSCVSVPVAVHVAFQLSNGQDPVFYKDSNCSQTGMVMAVIGDSGSTPSISIARTIGSFNVPLVSPFATCACLSDKKQFPTFFRTIPSDQFQADALAKLVKHFGWTWIGAVYSDSDYGNFGMSSFLAVAQKEGICVEYTEAFFRTDPHSKIQRIADVIRRSTAMVIVAFTASGDMSVLLEELALEPSPPRQWIGSEGWVTDPLLMGYSFCAGAIGVAIQKSVIPGLRDFLLDLSPTEVADSPVLTEFWEDAFNCSLKKSKYDNLGKRECDGTEDIKTLENPYTETSQLRVTNMVYKAVYAVAHAIHNAMCKERNLNFECDKHFRLESKQVFTELKKVNFSQNGYPVSFDANGDPVAFYELVNWQKRESGSIDLITVGYYDGSLSKGQELHIYRNITWVKHGTEIPVSVCSETCPLGTRKVLQKGKPICCYDCIPCPEGEISNKTDSPDCFTCPSEFWSNAQRDACFPKPVEFLSFDELLAIILATFSGFGACLAIITGIIFFRHRTTPIVRANNSELSFLLLFSLTLCFLCSLTFIGAPSEWSCMLRHTAFGIIFVLCISCVLGKTVVVLMAFKATLPGSNAMKWFGPPQQRMTVVFFTFIQVLICTVWLVLSPPFPIKNLTTYKEKIILECALGSVVGFWAVLGYIGLLANNSQ